MMNLVDTLSIVKSRQDFGFLRSYFSDEFPITIQALRLIDKDCTESKKHKGFNLVKRESKKRGFVYYVRYYHNGAMLSSKWNTQATNPEEAERFARENRERLIGSYLQRREGRGLEIFRTFYEENSEFLTCEKKRNRPISDTTRRNYRSVIINKVLPFLKLKNVTGYEGITVKILDDFQDYYLALGIKPQTVNDYLKAVKRVLQYLARKGHIAENPRVRNIPVHDEDKTERGCYELTALKGVFTRRWRDQEAYLLCLLIYTTGMRNSEIREMSLENIITMGGCRFINIKRSKTANGVRLAPLHEKVYQKLKAYCAGKSPGEKPFGKCTSVTFSEAARELARIIQSGNRKAETEGITFYSGRHFWKTLMNSEGLGEDIEEIFMGHKVSNDVSKLYNHRDKQGKERMVKKAKKVFAILDKCIFMSK